jgi:hypothetical protein
MDAHSRYPGAQPFVDEPLSRSVFFGRKMESRALADLILASRLVIVYAKSGVGKTSLLQAGVAQLLRDDGCLPLFVRVNDPKLDPLQRVLGGVADAARRQDVEYQAGDTVSLWHFFKTAEFWRDDRLLTPVLVLDQFEELFTLHDVDTRARFMRELGYLVRGVRPPVGERSVSGHAESLTDSPPDMHIVVSMREDYLGSLEEGADFIPRILDHRFRLTALTLEAAEEAMEAPAQVKDDQLTTRPFHFKEGTVNAILTHLSRRTRGSTAGARMYVEPFHLQLVCQRVEAEARARQKDSDVPVEIGLNDVGGESGLNKTLRDFFLTVLQRIEPRRTRRRVRRLCQHYLISPEGRRLSVERTEIRRVLKLQSATLASLVEARLLRSDQRADSWYFELSHDSLIAPILASRKTQAMALGIAGLILSLVLALFSLGVLAVAVFFIVMPFISNDRVPAEAWLGAVFGLAFFLLTGSALAWMSVSGVRRSVETLNRYSPPPL